MPATYGRAGNAVPDTRGVPLPTGTRTYQRTTRPDTSPFRRDLPEFTPEQLSRAGYRNLGTGERPRKGGNHGRGQLPRERRSTIDHDRIAAMYLAGATVAEIHRETGHAHATIRRSLDSSGVPRDRKRRGPDDSATALKALLDANGATAADVREWATRHGYDVQPQGTPSRVLVEHYLLARTGEGAA